MVGTKFNRNSAVALSSCFKLSSTGGVVGHSSQKAFAFWNPRVPESFG